MTVSVTMIQTRMGESGSYWTAGNSYEASEDYARYLVQYGWATASFGDRTGYTPPKGYVGDDGRFQLLDHTGGVITLSELIPEVLANATATTTVKTGAGAYAGYRCTTATGNITIYDHTAASGKVLVPTTALALGSFPAYGAGHPGRIVVNTGVTVVLSGAGVVYVGVE